MTSISILISFTITIFLMIILVSKFKVHPALSILLATLFLAISIDTPVKDIVPTIEEGFGNTVKSIALVVLLGSFLGKILEETGAAVSITQTILRIFGKKHAIWAIALSSGILGIPIFGDTVVILLIPVVSILAIETNESMMKYGGALYLGALVTASLVPPTPGPVAAASLLNLPLGEAILWGLIISIPSITAGVIYLNMTKTYVPPKKEYIESDNIDKSNLPSIGKSLIPILLPIILIQLNTYFTAKYNGGKLERIFSFLGDPLIALLIACISSIILIGPKWKSKEVLNNWVETGIIMSAVPIIITGLGGSLAQFVKNTEVAEELAEKILSLGIPGILIPIIMAALIHVITGSNALGVMTTAALMEPIMDSLGLSPLATFLACGTGALLFKHSNSSGFWVTTSMSNMSLVEGLISIGGFSTVAGLTGAIITIILHTINVI